VENLRLNSLAFHEKKGEDQPAAFFWGAYNLRGQAKGGSAPQLFWHMD
jgi:hypothetical protein